MKIRGTRTLPFFLSLLTWATLSSPTPGNFGLPEILVFVLISIFLIMNFKFLVLSRNEQLFIFIQTILLPILAILSALYSDAGLNTPRKISRDFIPFYFLPVGIICGIILIRLKANFNQMLLLLILCSMILATRHFAENGFAISSIGMKTYVTDGNYFLVEQVFLAGGLLGFAKFLNTKDPNLQAIPWFICLCAAIIFLAASLSQVLRGHFLIIFFVIAYGLYLRMSYTIFVFIPIILLISLPLQNEFGALVIDKIINVGDNNRVAELITIYSGISERLSTFFFGKGFGGFQKTETGGTGMFAHNFIAYYLLKIGVVGTLIYTASILILIYHSVVKHVLVLKRVSVYIIFITILYYVFIQPGFKSIGFIYILAIFYYALKSEKDELVHSIYTKRAHF